MLIQFTNVYMSPDISLLNWDILIKVLHTIYPVYAHTSIIVSDGNMNETDLLSK